jgi:quinate dehydrogenase (quinone)
MKIMRILIILITLFTSLFLIIGGISLISMQVDRFITFYWV